jgi:mannose-6-phosphate isomerase-like protein (cupin superfamily)
MKVIHRFQPQTEFYTDEGCHIVELLNAADDAGCSIARARVLPGVTTRLHCLRGTIERYVILQGEGRVEVAQAPPTAVRALDVVVIPAGAPQRIENTGAADLVFLCICTPRFEQRNYADAD